MFSFFLYNQLKSRDATHLKNKHEYFKMILLKNNIPIHIFDILTVFTLKQQNYEFLLED